MKKILILLAFLSSVVRLQANNIKVENVSYDKNTNRITFELSWENAWRQTSNFHDAAWVFAKYRTVNQPRWQHVDIVPSSTNAGGILETIETNDRLGFYVRFNTDSLGHVLPTQVSFEPTDNSFGSLAGLFPDFQVFAIEMVYVPRGDFYVGAPITKNESDLFEDLVLYTYNNTSNISIRPYNPIHIVSENQISSGPINIIPYLGNKSIPATFPKGYDSFYCMKQEISNDQLVSFFNTIGTDPSRFYGLGFKIVGNNFVYNNVTLNQDSVDIIGTSTENGYVFTCKAGYENHPAVMTPYTLINYLSWAGMAPMTELQYVKACRGPLYPVWNEAASGIGFSTILRGNTWASADTFFVDLNTPNERLKRHYPSPSTPKLRRCGYAADSSTNRITANATFYGILNMSDNVAEITISISDTNSSFAGYIGSPDSPPDLAASGIFEYIIPAYFSESGTGYSVIYYRGTEDGPLEYYDPNNLLSPTRDDGIVTNYFHYPIGGRGVRKPR
ncbi:MAG: hypothetical protein EP332_09015 [Bacteroidetes bacterium]|nr:MAG: hypothetical protein EP332_09015 [Bacteroidota bacterium]